MLTARENMLRIFRHEMPEWIPIVGHVDPYNQPNKRDMDPELAESLANVKWQDDSTVVFSRYLGLDIMDYMSAPIRSIRNKVTVESSSEDNDTTNIWHTPKGDLREVIRHSPEIGSSYRSERLVKSPDDLSAFASIFEDEEFKLDPDGLERLRAKRKLIGDDGMLICFTNGTPLGMMVRVHSGVETLAYLCADCPDEMHSLFAAMADNHLRVIRLAASADEFDAIVGMDDTSTTAISPGMFEEYCLDYTDRAADASHEQETLYFHHSCGLIKNILNLYRGTRMDAIHGFTIPPIGDVTVGEARKLLKNSKTIMAGLAQIFGDMSDRAAVAESIKTMCDEAAPGDHFILGLAGDPEKGMEETTFVAEEAKKHQRRIIGGAAA